MYMRFFGLKQEPFSLAPDPRYLYMSKRHREALAHLLYGVGGGGGFVLLSGEIGAGKTTVCRCFLEQIPKRCNVAYIFNPKLTVLELLRTICNEFGIAVELPPGQAPTVTSYVDPLNAFLLQTHSVGQNNVLIIDEAQNLSADVLEQLRLLTNLETSERKLLQIVLIGQPELRTMLERPELEQLAQRVIARFHLKALSEKETEHYIRHRLSVAGMTRATPFEHKGLLRIHEISRGVPRRINLLCDRAMLGAYAHGRQQVDVAMIEKAAHEVFGRSDPALPDRSRFGSGAGVALVAVCGVALIALLGFAGREAWRRYAPAEAAAATPPIAALSASSAASQTAAGTLRASTPMPDAASAVPAMHSASAADKLTLAPAASSPTSAALAATTAAPTDAVAPDGSVDWKSLARSENTAWRELATLWDVPPDHGDACAAAARQQVRCSKFTASIGLVRRLGRPGFMAVRDDAGHIVDVLLVGLGSRFAELRGEGETARVPLAALEKRWQGEFGTLWRLPAGYVSAVADGASGPVVDRLATQLALAAGEPAPPSGQSMDAALHAKVARFQSAHGLRPVGRAGPTTFMQLNRASGIDEPVLAVVDDH